MKTIFALALALLSCSPLRLGAAASDEEQKLVAVLLSNASPGEKDAACARLKFVGTSRCVPALAALLTDDQLSHSARYALESLAFDEAGGALLDALGKTKGLLQVGLINSLAAREDTRAVAALAPLLQDTNLPTACASARALGQIGGADALKALRAGARNSPPALHAAAVDGLLRCASRLLASGQRSGALAVYEQLDNSEENAAVRQAAFAGRVRASGNPGLVLVLHAITGPADPSQVAALQLARELQVPNTTKELANLLPDLKSPVQISLVGALAQRGDTSVLPALTALATSAQPEVRVPIIQALDELGDASVVPLLANLAASNSAEEQKAARVALTDLHRGDVTQALVDQLTGAGPPAQSESARALGARGDKAAVPKLLEAAQRGPESARRAALQALSVLADDSQLGALVALLLQAKDPMIRSESADALNAAYRNIVARRGHADTTPLIQGFEKGSLDDRAALLPICSGLSNPKVRSALRVALHDQNPQLHNAAVRAVCDTTDPELLHDLLELAKSAPEDSSRAMAITAAVRLLTQEETVKLAANLRVAALKVLLNCAARPEEKRQVLAGLGEVPDLEALAAVGTVLEDKTVRNEAASATVKIATALPGSQAPACEDALKKALAAATDDGTRQAARAALQQIQDNADYLTSWEVAGPYQQADKDFAALFDIAFPPESKAAPEVKWRMLPAGSDPKRPWVMDLLKALGGQQRVAYARTWIHSDHEHAAVLELGSDDGVRVWFNEKPVYALNVARALQPGSDKVKVRLHSGWNPLLLKITQDTQGWEFCVRIRNADGSHLDGVRCESAPKTSAAGP